MLLGTLHSETTNAEVTGDAEAAIRALPDAWAGYDPKLGQWRAPTFEHTGAHPTGTLYDLDAPVAETPPGPPASEEELLAALEEPPVIQPPMLFSVDGVDQDREFTLDIDNMVLGRGMQCHAVLTEPSASRKHARIIREGDTFRLIDLQSANGTFLNGRRIQSEVIQSGDQIGFGRGVFLFLEPHDARLTQERLARATELRQKGHVGNVLSGKPNTLHLPRWGLVLLGVLVLACSLGLTWARLHWAEKARLAKEALVQAEHPTPPAPAPMSTPESAPLAEPALAPVVEPAAKAPATPKVAVPRQAAEAAVPARRLPSVAKESPILVHARGIYARGDLDSALDFLEASHDPAAPALKDVMEDFLRTQNKAVAEHRAKHVVTAIALLNHARELDAKIAPHGSAFTADLNRQTADMYYVQGIEHMLLDKLPESYRDFSSSVAASKSYAPATRKLDELANKAKALLKEGEALRDTHPELAQANWRLAMQIVPAGHAVYRAAEEHLASVH